MTNSKVPLKPGSIPRSRKVPMLVRRKSSFAVHVMPGSGIQNHHEYRSIVRFTSWSLMRWVDRLANTTPIQGDLQLVDVDILPVTGIAIVQVTFADGRMVRKVFAPLGTLLPEQEKRQRWDKPDAGVFHSKPLLFESVFLKEECCRVFLLGVYRPYVPASGSL